MQTYRISYAGYIPQTLLPAGSPPYLLGRKHLLHHLRPPRRPGGVNMPIVRLVVDQNILPYGKQFLYLMGCVIYVHIRSHIRLGLEKTQVPVRYPHPAVRSPALEPGDGVHHRPVLVAVGDDPVGNHPYVHLVIAESPQTVTHPVYLLHGPEQGMLDGVVVDRPIIFRIVKPAGLGEIEKFWGSKIKSPHIAAGGHERPQRLGIVGTHPVQIHGQNETPSARGFTARHETYSCPPGARGIHPRNLHTMPIEIGYTQYKYA